MLTIRALGAALALSLPLVAQSLPSAPNVQPTPVGIAAQGIPCTMPSGRPCSGWLYKLIGPYPIQPEEDLTIHYPTHSTGFFHFYGRPNRKSWVIFIAAQGCMWAAMSRSHEELRSEAFADAGLTGVDTLLFIKVSPSLSVEGPIFATTHYIRDRVQ